MRAQGATFVALLTLLSACAESVPRTDDLPRWSASLLWRTDGTGANAVLFEDLRDFVVDGNEVVWALDFATQQVRRFDANGTAIGTVGRKGSGPGEFVGANGLLIVPDGTVWVHDPRESRVTVFDSTGSYRRQHVVPIGDFTLRWDAWVQRASGLIVDPFTDRWVGGDVPPWRWRRLTRDGAVQDTLSIPSCHASGAPEVSYYSGVSADGGTTRWEYYPFTAGGGAAPDGGDGFWCATPTSSRAVRLRIGRGDTIATSSLDVPDQPVTEGERAAAIRDAETLLRGFPRNTFDAAKIPTRKPAIALLSVDDDARLWIQHTTRVGDSSTTFDVHDSTGVHLGRLTIPFLPSPTGLAVRARGRELWVALRDEQEFVSIARFRIEMHAPGDSDATPR